MPPSKRFQPPAMPHQFARIVFMLLMPVLLAACVMPPITPPANRDTLYQTATLSALQSGQFDGALPVGDLLRHGDFGLGTFNALDGEMIVLDGVIYQGKDDGIAYVADAAVLTPFAAVTFFEADQTLAVDAPMTCAALQGYLDEQLPALDAPVAIKVSGNFATLQVRAPHRESPPYPTLTDALADQAVFDSANISGTLVGFRLPDYMAGLNAAGYHFHYISDDHRAGGHLLDCQTDGVTVEIDTIDTLQVEGIVPAAPVPASQADASQTEANAADAVVLGALYNLTGSQAELDVPSAQGAQLAVDQANADPAAAGLAGPVQLVIADGQTDAATVTAQMEMLATEHPDVAAFLGLSDTDMVLAAAPVAADHGRIFLTSGATSPLLPGEVPDTIFLACFGDNVQAAAAAEWAYTELGARTAAILFDETSTYTQLLQGYFATRFTELGGIIDTQQSYTGGDIASITAAIDGLEDADLFFVAAGPADAPEVARLLRAAGFTAPIVGGDGFDSGPLWQQYPELDNVYFTTHAYLGDDNPSPHVQDFVAAYRAAYLDQTPSAFAALGYDAVRLLLQAITDAGSAAPDAVHDALANIQQFDGVTGTISFTPGNPIPNKSVTILAVQAGDYHFVDQVTPQQVPAADAIAPAP